MVDYIKNYILKSAPGGDCDGCIYHTGKNCVILTKYEELNGDKIGCVIHEKKGRKYFIIVKSIKKILKKL